MNKVLSVIGRRGSDTDGNAIALCGFWPAAVLALLAGLALPFAFAPTNLTLIAPLSVTVLYLMIQGRSSRQAAMIGWLFGAGYFGIGVHWIYHSLHFFGGAASVFAIFITILLVLIMTTYSTVASWVFVRFAMPHAWISNVWFFAALWALGEFIRNVFLGGFPWLLLGYAQTTEPLGALAPLIGVYGIGFLMIVMTLSAVEVLLLKQRAPRVIAFGTVLLIGFAAWFASTLTFTEAKPKAMGVRLAQANIEQAVKFSRERLIRSLDDYLALSEQDLGDDIDLVVWPETAIPTSFPRVEEYIAPAIARLEARGVDVLAGGFDRDGEDVYNAVRQLGGEKQMYRKRHLVPFGEYIPFRGFIESFSAYIAIPGSDLASGSGPHIPMQIGDESIGMSICYEDVFGEEMRALLPASSLLVNVSNDAWFGDSAAPHQHEQKARMRARELGRPLIRVTNTGVSSAIRHDGSIIDRIPQGVKGVLDVQVYPRTGTTPYVIIGNWPVMILSVCLVLLRLWRRRSRVRD